MFKSYEGTIKKGFHTKDDRPEIRERFFKLITTLDFKYQVFIAKFIRGVSEHDQYIKSIKIKISIRT